jgi:hypothetical protein
MKNKFKDINLFQEYLKKFESSVMVKSYELFNKNRSGLPFHYTVPIRAGSKLKEFKTTIGTNFEYDDILALNYYGYYKVSSYIMKRVKALNNIFPNIRVVSTPVIFFNAILPATVEKISPVLSQDFLAFKDELVRMRWGEK